MHPIDALWHVLNFLAPAVVVGLLASAAAKGLWRRTLASVPWRRLALWAMAGGAAMALTALLVWGRDGTMAGYALLVAGAAIGLWWAGFGPGRRA